MLLLNTLFLNILNMSLVGAFVICAIIIARIPLKKAPKSISYGLWLVAGLRLVLPFSFESQRSLIPFVSPVIPIEASAAYVMQGTDELVSIMTRPASSVFPWLNTATAIWLIGAVAMFAYGAAAFVRLRRKVSTACSIDFNVYEADIHTPFVLGFFNPKIYLPLTLAESERKYILLHEQRHIMRCDNITKIIAFYILCLHWFNPLAWAAFCLMSSDMEMSCDEYVLSRLSHAEGIRKSYSLSLLNLAANHRSPIALNFMEGSTKKRINNVLGFKRSPKLLVVLTLAFAIALSGGLLSNQVAQAGAASSNFIQVSVQDRSYFIHPGYSIESSTFRSTRLIGGSQMQRVYGHFIITGIENMRHFTDNGKYLNPRRLNPDGGFEHDFFVDVVPMDCTPYTFAVRHRQTGKVLSQFEFNDYTEYIAIQYYLRLFPEVRSIEGY